MPAINYHLKCKGPAAALLIGCGLMVSCSSRVVMLPDGSVLYKSTRFGTSETIKEIEFVSADGSKIIIKGYGGDQVEALTAVTDAAVKAAVKSVVP